MSDRKYPYIDRHVEEGNMEDRQAEDFELEQRNMVTKANRDNKRDEWPQVGDEAVVSNEKGRELIYGHEVIGEKTKVLALYSVAGIGMAVVDFDGCGYCFRVEMLQKPKTPGEELLDELSQYLDNSYSNAADIEADKSAFKSFAVDLMGKYNITKKEQGND